MKYFIDSNIFLRFLEHEDKLVFEECSDFLHLVDNSKINAFTSSFVLSEIVWVLDSYYKENKSKIVGSLNAIHKLGGLKINNNVNTLTAIGLFESKKVKFIDALIASNPDIQSKKMTVVSYDKDFDKLGIKRLEPKDFL